MSDLTALDVERELRSLLDGYLERIHSDGHRVAGSGLISAAANSVTGLVSSKTWGARQQAEGFLAYVQKLRGMPQASPFGVTTEDGWTFSLYVEDHDHGTVIATRPGHRYRIDPSFGSVDWLNPLWTDANGIRG